jgi:hypothetical protein
MKITYLFGAGASKNSIPITEGLIESMNEELRNFRDNFTSILNEVKTATSHPHISDPEKGEKIFKQFLSDFELIINSSRTHQSIDTFAKKLHIQKNHDTLNKLKTILSLYFIIVQSRKYADVRYDSFFASILEENHSTFPKNLKILSWNYDYQIEKAHSVYSGDPRIESCIRSLNIFSKNSLNDSFDSDKFGIIKLNGTAAFMLHSENNKPHLYFDFVDAPLNSSLTSEILANYVSLQITRKDEFIPALSFAWEDREAIVKKAIEFTKSTEILVVIGYSFPFFNRFIDRDIIRAMKNLKKVYFQAPDAGNLKERFLAIRDDIEDKNLEPRNDIKQFVFPNEF